MNYKKVMLLERSDMKKLNIFLCCALFLIFSCKSIDYRIVRARAEYKKDLRLVKRHVDGKTIDKVIELNKSVRNLERLSSIKSHMEEGFENSIMPTKGNYIDWQQWYKDNKNIIFWNEEHNRIESLDLKSLTKDFKK